MSEQSITIADMQKLVEEYASLREEKAKAEDVLKEINQRVTDSSNRITMLLQDNKQDNFRVSGVGLVSLKKTESVPTPKTEGDRRALWKYIVDKYGESVAYSTFAVHAATLNAFFKQERQELPKEEQLFFQLPGTGEPSVHYSIAFKSDKGGE